MPGRRVCSTLVAFLASVLPSGAALACPVCFSGVNERVLTTYYLTALMMTLLPFVLIGLFGTWLYVRFRESSPEPAAQTDREPRPVVS